MAEQALIKILCKDGDNLYVSIRGSKVVLAREDPNDKTQRWFMDYSRANHVTSDNGQKAFALVNEATGEALVNKNKKQDDGLVHIQLAPYKDDSDMDISMLWTLVQKVHGDGFHQIATLRDNSLVFDGLRGNCKEGTIVGVGPSCYMWKDSVSDNQLWKIIPVGSAGTSIGRPAMTEPTVIKIPCKDGNNLHVSIRGSKVVLTRDDPNDKTQRWIMDYSRASHVTKYNGQKAFALVNEATGEALVNENKKQDDGLVHIQLAPYKDDSHMDISMLWTLVEKVHGDGFHQIATLRDNSLVFDGLRGNCKEGTIIGVGPSCYTWKDSVSDNQLWKIIPVGSVGTSIDRPTMTEPAVIKIPCKDGNNLYVCIRGSKVVLARDDPNDKTQRWIMDYSRASHVTKYNGQKAFALVNEATGEALVNENKKQDDGLVHIQLAPYKDDSHMDISMLWTLVQKVHDDGFHQIATLRDNSLVFDGLWGSCKEGTIVGVGPSSDTWTDRVYDNQLWKILPVGGGGTLIDRPAMAESAVVKIPCKDGNNLYVSIRGSKVVLARDDPNDKTQRWIMDYFRARHVTNNNGQKAFALVNEATGEALVNKDKKQDDGLVHIQLAPYKDDSHMDISMLWTLVEKVHGDGFHQIATLRDNSLVFDGLRGNCKEGTIVGVGPSCYTWTDRVYDNQLWKILLVGGSGTTTAVLGG